MSLCLGFLTGSGTNQSAQLQRIPKVLTFRIEEQEISAEEIRCVFDDI